MICAVLNQKNGHKMQKNLRDYKLCCELRQPKGAQGPVHLDLLAPLYELSPHSVILICTCSIEIRQIEEAGFP